MSEQKIWTWCGFQLKTAISFNSQLNKGEKRGRERRDTYTEGVFSLDGALRESVKETMSNAGLCIRNRTDELLERLYWR